MKISASAPHSLARSGNLPPTTGPTVRKQTTTRRRLMWLWPPDSFTPSSYR